ncbi:Kelch-like ECH-associated protein 1 [Liparis tanakae]|uniref:Kelch-like ECH-associated protein 1 n=1 Tax=Liparis tanakae TaxID=230148 RepID=A0A4Z2GL76_9TELE|nr:Kelch-like ECH-associated protein 1 [Liparis tanakae]
MMAFAWQRGCIQLYAAARQVVLTHFSAIVAEEDFLSLSKETVADLLACDDLVIHKDDLAVEATLCRVSFDSKREEHFTELIQLEKQSLYQFDPLSGRWQRCAPLQRKNLTQYSVAAVGDNMVVIGGYFRDVLLFTVDWVRIYECGNQRWVDGPALHISRHGHCSIGLDSSLYVLGGSMDEGLVADVEERLVLGSEEGWEEVSSCPNPNPNPNS